MTRRITNNDTNNIKDNNDNDTMDKNNQPQYKYNKK